MSISPPSTRIARTLLLVLALSGASAFSSPTDLTRLSDQLDRMDQLDFDDAIQKASQCVAARDFPCAEVQLKTARKRANGAKAKATLAGTEEALRAEREQVAEEALAAARREREIELAEERLREAEARAERQAEQAAREARESDNGRSTADNVALFGQLMNQALRNQAAARVADQARARQFDQMQSSVAASIAKDQQRFARERADLEAQRAALRQQQADASARTQARQQEQQREQQRLQAAREPLPQQQQTQRPPQVVSQRLPEAQRAERPTAAPASRVPLPARPGAPVRNDDVQVASGSPERVAAGMPPTPVATGGPVAPNGRTGSPGVDRPAPTAPQPTPQPTPQPVAASNSRADPGEPDADGCIDAIGWCSSAPQVEQNGTVTTLRFHNTCPFRVYGTFINGLANGRVDAGADGVPANGTKVWTTHGGNGRGFVRIIGSTKASGDWTCGSKVSAFRAGDATLDRNRKTSP